MAIVLFLPLNLYRILFGTEPLITKSHETWTPGFAKTVFQGIFDETVMLLFFSPCSSLLSMAHEQSFSISTLFDLLSELNLAYIFHFCHGVCSTELAQHAFSLYIRTTRVVTLYIDDPS